MTHDVRETEWRFDAVDLRPVVRWLEAPAGWIDKMPARVASSGNASQVDRYFDTDDQRLHRAGYALRLRRAGRRAGDEATLESLDSATNDPGQGRRREISEPLDQADPSRVIDTAGPVGMRVRALAGSRRLRLLFEVRTRRRLYVLESDTFPAAEISLDETAIHLAGGGAPARIRRVGIRVPGPAVDDIRQFVDWLSEACVLQPAALSKYEVGRLSAALEAPPPFQYGPTVIDVDASIRAVALSVLRRHFAVMLAREPGTRLGDDIEELHDMRVATRRLRAALSLFEDVLPVTVTKLSSELAWLGRALGEVRDLDVQLVELDRLSTEVPKSDRAALAALRALLENQHAVARTEMLDALDSRRYETFVGRFGRTLSARHESRSGNAARPARAIAPDLIEDSFRSFRKAGDRIRPGSPATDYHRLRTRGKRARYTLEFLGDLYPGRTEPLVKALTSLQDILGLHQDADVAIDRLRRLAAQEDALGPETIFAMGEIAERYRQSMIDLRARFPKAYRQVSGRRWKALRKAIEAKRPPSVVGPPPSPLSDETPTAQRARRSGKNRSHWLVGGC
jgi:CHAD domain-containing protein